MSDSELFRFVTLRQARSADLHVLDGVFVRDRRNPSPAALRSRLFRSPEANAAFQAATEYMAGNSFIGRSDPRVLGATRLAAVLRDRLEPGAPVADIRKTIEDDFPAFGSLLVKTVGPAATRVARQLTSQLWDSLYASVVAASGRPLSNAYLGDALRVLHVIRLLWVCGDKKIETWPGRAFDEYEILIEEELNFRHVRAPAPAAQPARTGGRRLRGGSTRRTISAATATGGGDLPVALEVGAFRPLIIGDLIKVTQELRRYELGEIADIQNVMAKERREQRSRELSRSTQSTERETSSEREESESRSSNEESQLSSEAQRSASKQVSFDTGVNVSATYGPVTAAVTMNASASSSKSSSDSTSESFAKTVTEEATKRVREAIRESSSITIVNENERTALQGFNNETSDHVRGIYRWVEKIYTARTVNYGRRLMFEISVPEPAAFFRGRIASREQSTIDELEKPVSPLQSGLNSFQDIDTKNYAKLAAKYGASVSPPPPHQITGSKAISHPSSATADRVVDHSAAGKELTLVMVNETLTVDPDYHLRQVGVFAPKGSGGGLRAYADTLKLGEKNDFNALMVLVGDKSFYLNAKGGGRTGKTVSSNFNKLQDISTRASSSGMSRPGTRVAQNRPPFTGLIQNSLPIAVSADFEGVMTFNVVYTAELSPEGLDRWKAAVYDAIVQAYRRQVRDYEEKLAIARSSAIKEIESQTFDLRASQYRAIELTELKRGAIGALTMGTALGWTSVAADEDGNMRTIFDADDVPGDVQNWRSPMSNGAVAEFFEEAFEWEQATYDFHPYYWTDSSRWRELTETSSGDPVFQKFLQAGNAKLLVPVRPDHERSVTYFLKTGLIWSGDYLPLFEDEEMLNIHREMKNGKRFDPPLRVSADYEIRLPTSHVLLQKENELPEFPPKADDAPAEDDASVTPSPEDAPF